MLAEVFAYPKWPQVLAHFGLAPLTPVQVEGLAQTAPQLEGFGGGESAAHKALKEYVAGHPQSVGIVRKIQEVATDFKLPTGDAIDVLFKTKRQWIAVEVKSTISTQDDLMRGVFQCVKYNALLEATHKAEAMTLDIDVILAVGGPLPEPVRQLAIVLGIDVLSEVGQNI
jgi:hypothetical protein